MNAQQEATLSTLYDLIETCRDGQEGFRKASECIVDAPELKKLLASFSVQRGKFARDLEGHYHALGGTVPEERSSVAGALHRWWMDLENAVLPEDNHRILVECERGEDTAKEEYRKALAQLDTLPDSVRGIALWQEREIIAVHDTVKALRDAQPDSFREILATASETFQDKGFSHGFAGTRAGHGSLTRDLKKRAGNPLAILALALGAGALIGLVFYAFELRNDRRRLEFQSRPWRPLRRLGRGAQAKLDDLRDRARSGVGFMQDRIDDMRGTHHRRSLMRRLRHSFDRLFE